MQHSGGSLASVSNWLQYFDDQGIPGLHDLSRHRRVSLRHRSSRKSSGRPGPQTGAHGWSMRTLATTLGFATFCVQDRFQHAGRQYALWVTVLGFEHTYL